MRQEPVPVTDIERKALARACPACFADPGVWCASVAARNDYLSKLHAVRLVPSLAAGPAEPDGTR